MTGVQTCALPISQDAVGAAVASYRERRDAACALLRSRGVAHVEPQGAFYLMVDVGEPDTEAFALRLLERRHVAVAPGSTFGDRAAGMVRVSLAAPRELLLDGLSRLADEVTGTGRGGPGTGDLVAAAG